MKWGWRMIPSLARAIFHATVYLVAGRPVIAPKQISDWRMSVCRECRHFIAGSEQCTICYCLAEMKTLVASETCPIGRWKNLTDSR